MSAGFLIFAILWFVAVAAIFMWARERNRREQVEREYNDLMARHRVWGDG